MKQGDERGTSLVEVMLAAGLFAVLAGMAVPLLRTGQENVQVMVAARYLAGQAMLARSRAIRSGAVVGLRFQAHPGGYQVRSYVDGDGDGLQAADIAGGVDRPLDAVWRLPDVYPGVRLELHPSVPPVGETSGTSGDPVRFGASNIAAFSPLGTASSGTLYLRGLRSGEQYAVRVLGATGRVRVLRFDPVRDGWVDR